jgi:hypothetical protein
MKKSVAEHVWQDKEAEGATSHHKKVIRCWWSQVTIHLLTGTVVIYMLGMNKRKAPGRTTMMMLPDKKKQKSIDLGAGTDKPRTLLAQRLSQPTNKANS